MCVPYSASQDSVVCLHHRMISPARLQSIILYHAIPFLRCPCEEFLPPVLLHCANGDYQACPHALTSVTGNSGYKSKLEIAFNGILKYGIIRSFIAIQALVSEFTTRKIWRYLERMHLTDIGNVDFYTPVLKLKQNKSLLKLKEIAQYMGFSWIS